MSLLAELVADWHPRPQVLADRIDPQTLARAADLLHLPLEEGADVLPPLWEWLYFADWTAKTELSEDGHPHHGTFQPPLPNRRRMWAGGSTEYFGSLRVDTPTTRTGSLVSCEPKSGRSGDMLLVTVQYDYAQDGQVLARELQNHVYRIGTQQEPRPDWGPRPSIQLPAAESDWYHPIVADPIDLFRFSALTCNSHRIHYDRPYATEVEGYPGLVVHGPLLGMHLAALSRRHAPELRLTKFELRLAKPVFVGEPVAAVGDVQSVDGNLTAELRIVSVPDVVHATARASYATSS